MATGAAAAYMPSPLKAGARAEEVVLPTVNTGMSADSEAVEAAARMASLFSPLRGIATRLPAATATVVGVTPDAEAMEGAQRVADSATVCVTEDKVRKGGQHPDMKEASEGRG